MTSIDRPLFLATLVGSLFLAGCSSSESSKPASTSQAWETIIEGDWTMPINEEGYVCARKTVDRDLYVNGFEAIAPPGTHHTLLTMGDPSGPDGVGPCTIFELHALSVFASGVGTDVLNLPKGVAMRIPAGQQLLLNLHLFNTGTAPLSGTSGQRVRLLDESEVTDLAEGILAGPTQISLDPGQTKTTSGTCTMAGDTTLFAVAPHMHVLGIHEKVTAQSSVVGDVVIHDAAYDFEEQSFSVIDPLPMKQGDKVLVDCTHHNTTTNPVIFGESTLSEMCFAGLYRYPAVGGWFICADDFAFPGLPDAGP